MLHYLAQREQAFTFTEYLGHWGRDLTSFLRVAYYEDLQPQVQLAAGTYLFSGVDRLNGDGRHLASQLARQFDDVGAPVLNHPDRTLQRAALLQALHAAGRNVFTAVRVDADLDALRYPVFLRRASRHDGPLSPLLRAPSAVQAAIGWEVMRGTPMDDLLIVEFLDTSSDGYFRKFAAFVVGHRIVPRSLSFGRHWMRKHHGSKFTRAMVEEELAYVSGNPHAAELREIVDLARVDYGRIDYSMLNGRVQTWEINLNPTVGRGSRPTSGTVPAELEPVRTESKHTFYAGFADAWRALDAAQPGGQEVTVELPASLLDGLRREPRPRVHRGPEPLSRKLLRAGERLARPALAPLLGVFGRRARAQFSADHSRTHASRAP
jgi:hypothetical protein